MDSWKLNGHTLEYIDEVHTYLVDGVIVPSVTQILKWKFNNKYDFVSPAVLKRAAERGTATHKAIEDYCKSGIEDDSMELKNFKFLQKHYKFEVLENEIPVIIFLHDEPLCAGRLDMVLKIGDEIGGADIKRTTILDKEYLAYQLNMYRIGYKQSYGQEWKFLKGIHLRDDTRRFVNIPINEDLIIQFLEEYNVSVNADV